MAEYVTGYDTGYDTGILILTLILILIVVGVLAILNIVLLFKIFVMAKDMKEIKNKIPANDRIRDAELAFLNGNIGIAKKILDEYLQILIEKQNNNFYAVELRIQKQRLLSTYKYIGIDVPEGLS